MADDKLSDSHGNHDESDESTPLAPELSETAPIDDRETGDGYVDDPETDDINEAKLDRATDEVSDHDHDDLPVGDADAVSEGTAASAASGASVASRRPRSSRPVRRASRVETDVEEPAELREADEADELEPTPAVSRRRTVEKKGHATPSRGADTERRTTPAAFVNEAVGELRKVVWPTANQVQQYFVVVLVFVLFIIFFVSLLDLGLGWALLKVFG
ncbi:preprotein translocase subunit SecE [Mariniluteicoccus flavus]